jgi:hypothetical protein
VSSQLTAGGEFPPQTSQRRPVEKEAIRETRQVLRVEPKIICFILMKEILNLHKNPFIEAAASKGPLRMTCKLGNLFKNLSHVVLIRAKQGTLKHPPQPDAGPMHQCSTRA